MPQAEKRVVDIKNLPGIPYGTRLVEQAVVFDPVTGGNVKVRVTGSIAPSTRGITSQPVSFLPERYEKMEGYSWLPFSPNSEQVAQVERYMKSVISRKISEYAISAMVNLADKILNDYGYSEDKRTASVERKADARNLALFIKNISSAFSMGSVRVPKFWLASYDDRLLMIAPKLVRASRKVSTALNGLRGSFYEAAQNELASALSGIKDSGLENSIRRSDD